MRQIREMSVLQIELTNICTMQCSNCTRFCGHYPTEKMYYMDLDFVEKALKTVVDFPGIIGAMGGEPPLHPQFPEICELYKKYLPDKARRGLWSNKSVKFHEHLGIIQDTFGFFNLNDHISTNVMHTPILVASKDQVPDKETRHKYIDQCWINMYWSASINPRGAYFCEVAASMAWLFDGPDGLDIDKYPNWWKLDLTDYQYQIDWACDRCGCALPLKPRRSIQEFDDASESNMEELKRVKSRKYEKNLVFEYEDGIDEEQRRNNTWYWNGEAV
jgi:hypothetical protein